MKNTPLIVTNFNQLTYLKNIINWFRWYYPNPVDNPIFIVDNGSTYKPLLEFYNNVICPEAILYTENNYRNNLRDFIDKRIKGKYEYYVISDPDIMPDFNTPPNFLEIWKKYLLEYRLHRVGFNLIIENLPKYLHEKDNIYYNERMLLLDTILVHDGFTGYKAPIDTTFALYSTKNSGWNSPMDGKDWGNSMRLFNAHHLGWYVNPDFLNDEMKYYFETAKYRIPGMPSAGMNNNRPKKYINENN